MNSDDEKEDDHIQRKDFELKVEQFIDHSQFCLHHLSFLIHQLNDINCLNQSDLYDEKLNEVNKVIHDLAENIHNIQQLYSQLNETERLKLDHQIDLLRTEIDCKMAEFLSLREQAIDSSQENISSIDTTNNNDLEQILTINQLRQRHIRENHLNDSYDLLEKELAYLREKSDEIAKLVAQQQTLSKTAYLKSLAQYPIHNASSVFQKAIHNRYITLASGVLLGASIGGPVGFIMGTKVGTLVALSGSAVGALSMNVMRQRATENDESQDNNTTAYHQAML